jgi:hypothetical protein
MCDSEGLIQVNARNVETEDARSLARSILKEGTRTVEGNADRAVFLKDPMARVDSG